MLSDALRFVAGSALLGFFAGCLLVAVGDVMRSMMRRGPRGGIW